MNGNTLLFHPSPTSTPSQVEIRSALVQHPRCRSCQGFIILQGSSGARRAMNSYFLVCLPEGARPPSPFSYRDDPWMSRQAENTVVMQSIQALRVPRNHLQRRSFHELIREIPFQQSTSLLFAIPICFPYCCHCHLQFWVARQLK